LPFLIPDSLTIDSHEVGHLVHVGGWAMYAGSLGETILGLRVKPEAVHIDGRGVVHLDGHPLCWPQGTSRNRETEPVDDGEPLPVACTQGSLTSTVVVERKDSKGIITCYNNNDRRGFVTSYDDPSRRAAWLDCPLDRSCVPGASGRGA
jgi:hypothetical protein